MANWIHDKTCEMWSDGKKYRPGEVGFSRDAAKAYFKSENFSYAGTPDWEPPIDPADIPVLQVQAIAEQKRLDNDRTNAVAALTVESDQLNLLTDPSSISKEL